MFVLPFSSPDATLATAGGKGANLARLARAGFAVPSGFIVTTAAYQAYVKAFHLTKVIDRALGTLDANPSADALEEASKTIREAFVSAKPTARNPAKQALKIDEVILDACRTQGDGPVAVRSSATAEDLPDFSFAGQQDTYLNVVGVDAVQKAVIACFGSLWTARAIGYRHRNGIPHSDVALAVVVQKMVQSEASGVLFTANPLTGHRGETVIDAIHGLGEALVSGQVEPDHYVVETATGLIRARTRGAKAVAIRSLESGGVTRTESATAASEWAIGDDTVRELVRLGRAVSAEYGGAPQDIEWALSGDKLHLLQSRPITSLFPLPPGLPDDPPALLFSFGAVQGMLEPMTPMGQEMFRIVSAAFSRLWGYNFEPGQVPALHFAAERMWMRFDPLLRNKLTRRLWTSFFPLMEAGSSEEFRSLCDDPRHIPARLFPTRETRARLVPFFRTVFPRVVYMLRDPNRARDEFIATAERMLATFEKQAAKPSTLGERVHFMRSGLGMAPDLMLLLAPIMAAGMAGIFRLRALSDRAGVPRDRFYEVLRGMPHNVTTEMDLTLWQVSRTIGADEESWELFQQSHAPRLAERWRARTLPVVAQSAVDGFLARYGARGVGEIDFGRTRWSEDPTHILQTVQNYLQLKETSAAPDVVFQRGQQAAEAAVSEIVATITQRLGPLQGKIAAFAASRARALAGVRETPKFIFIRIFGILRRMMMAGYEQLVAQGILESAQDGVYLRLDELLAIEAGYAIDWKALVRERKALWEREARRKLVPRLLAGDGRVVYGGGAAPQSGDGTVLQGTPVSPGSVEGHVRVVFEPHGARLEPGEILVCPGTDPAWTPLFMTAGGLVMEVGGLMTHGAVVAREYGIPAVVGLALATETLRTGMRIRVDGSSGKVQILEDGS